MGVFDSCTGRVDQLKEGKALLNNPELKAKIRAKKICREASHDDEKFAKQLDEMIKDYEETVKELEATLATEVAPEGYVHPPAVPPAVAKDETPPPAEKVFALNKYERGEFEDLVVAHKARLAALTAARDAAAAAKIPTHSIMTTPAEEDAMKILGLKSLVGK